MRTISETAKTEFPLLQPFKFRRTINQLIFSDRSPAVDFDAFPPYLLIVALTNFTGCFPLILPVKKSLTVRFGISIFADISLSENPARRKSMHCRTSLSVYLAA